MTFILAFLVCTPSCFPRSQPERRFHSSRRNTPLNLLLVHQSPTPVSSQGSRQNPVLRYSLVHSSSPDPSCYCKDCPLVVPRVPHWKHIHPPSHQNAALSFSILSQIRLLLCDDGWHWVNPRNAPCGSVERALHLGVKRPGSSSNIMLVRLAG